MFEHISKHSIKMMFVEMIVVSFDCVDDLDTRIGKSDSFEKKDVIIHFKMPRSSQSVLSWFFCTEISSQTDSG